MFSVVAAGRPVHAGRLLGGAVTGVALMLATGACQGVGPFGTSEKKSSAGLAIVPQDGGSEIQPDRPISIQVRDGRLQDVTVRTKGSKVDGLPSGDGRQWQSRWTLKPNATYEVVATALGPDGRTKSVVSSFRTLKPKRTFRVRVEAPFNKEKVGVGMPIVLNFDRPVVNKAQVERALEVRMSQPVEGAWRWDGKQRVVFRTRKFWPKGQKVQFVAHLSGLQGARNVYGAKDEKVGFEVGNKMISTINTKTHMMTVKRNGKKVRKMPISAGMGGVEKYTTTNGVHLAMSMEPHVVMTSPDAAPGSAGYYSQDVDDAVRISDTGEYVHSAPWSVGSQGSANVSHGCVNAAPEDASWFLNKTRRGDIIDISGTDRELDWNNGWGFWQLSWKKWLKGSALKRPVNPGAVAPEPKPTSAARPAPRTPPSSSPSASPSSTASPRSGG